MTDQTGKKYIVPFKRCGLISATFAIVQSIVWIFISVSFIVLHELSHKKLEDDGENFMITFHNTYVAPGTTDSNRVFVAMVLYVIISVVWFLSSLILIRRIRGNCIPYPRTRYTKGAYITWAVITFTICIVDLVLTIVIIRGVVSELTVDGASVSNFQIPFLLNDTTTHVHQKISAMEMMIVITTRLVVFWIANLICSAIIFAAPFALIKECDVPRTNTYAQYREDDYLAEDEDNTVCMFPVLHPSKTPKMTLKTLKKIFQEE